MPGSKPGERRGGRKAGTPNKSSLSREAYLRERREADGHKMSKDVLAISMNEFFKLATELKVDGNLPEDKRAQYIELLGKAADVAAKLAPYESPRLQSTTLVGDREKDTQHTLTVRYVRAAEPVVIDAVPKLLSVR